MDRQEDLDAALERSRPPSNLKFGAGTRRKLAAEGAAKLAHDEAVVAACYGWTRGAFANKYHLMVLTDQRVLVLDAGGMSKGSQALALDTMTAVSTGRSALSSSIKFTGAGSNHEVSGLSHQDAEALAASVSSAIAGRRADPSRQKDPGLAARLEEADDLLARGLISPQEHDRLRQRALGEA